MDLNDLIKELKFIKFKSNNEIFFHANSVNVFPRLKYPRVLFVDMYNKDKKALELYNKIYDVLRLFKFEPDKKFHPHITLARLHNPSIRKVAEFLSIHSMFKTAKFTVSEFHLYSSILNPKGAVHHLEASYPLKG